MADLDTAAKRRSGLNTWSPWRGTLPAPDGSVDTADRPETVFGYSGIAAAGTLDLVQTANIGLSGVLAITGDIQFSAATARGAGKSRKRRKKTIVEIDGVDTVVQSEEEAIALLEKAREEAEKTAELAVSRAAAATRRPAGKIFADARKTLALPEIKAPGLEDVVERIMSDIRSTYESALQDIEIAVLLRSRERDEEDDEEILLLLI